MSGVNFRDFEISARARAPKSNKRKRAGYYSLPTNCRPPLGPPRSGPRADSLVSKNRKADEHGHASAHPSERDRNLV